jgi:hypothetical protein
MQVTTVVLLLLFEVLRNRASLLMVVNGSVFELGMDGRGFVAISIDRWTLKGGMFTLIQKGADLLVFLIHFPLCNRNVSVDLIDSAFFIFRVICFEWGHIVRGLMLCFFCLYSIVFGTCFRAFGQRIQLFC